MVARGIGRAVLVAAIAMAMVSAVPAGVLQAAELVGGFDPSEFGTPLSPEAQERLTGEWWPVVVGAALGAADGAYSYVRARGYEPGSARYWAGMAAAVVVGGGLGAVNGSIQVGIRTARAGVQAGYAVYAWARAKIVNEALASGWRSQRR